MNKSLGILVLISLSACSVSRDPIARDSIRQEMNAALAAPAPAAEAINAALLPPLTTAAPAKPREPRFSLELNETPAAQVFYAIAADSRYSMLVHPDVTGNISIRLKDVTVLEALDAIRDMYGYDYKLDGRRISIMPKELQTRMYKVNYLTGQRDGRSQLRVQPSSVSEATGTGAGGAATGATGGTGGAGGAMGAGSRESSRVSTTTATDLWAELRSALDVLVGKEGGRSVMLSPMTGIIVVRGSYEDQQAVTSYLKAAQLSIERQVILEAKIMEVQLNASFQSGVNWGVFKNGPNSHATAGLLSPNTGVAPSTAAGLGTILSTAGLAALPGSAIATGGNPGSLIGLAFQTSNFAALLSFLETQGDVHVLSSPRIATLNNQKAILKVGTDEYFVTGVTPSGTQTTGNTTTNTIPTVTMTPFFSGIMLDVTPDIDDKGNITLHVHPSIGQITTVTKIITLAGQTYSMPMAASTISETDSIVRAKDGQIIAIGGLMRQASTDDRSGLPGLPKSIFGQTSKVTQKRELVILIKPTIVDTDEDWSEDIRKSRDRMERLNNGRSNEEPVPQAKPVE
ncbi:secretin N-terminal domain-containing protein [Ferriphaselus sp. R-1]|uniref:secretin N-terminal domain-containing protein n=1 Tax=Ferriphaselus sp. R-1 TaxID=1485544 RepID=UPI000554706B|nr:secretin N-terminal domain-containing protein [Ferriphaselus sp. R-1]